MAMKILDVPMTSISEVKRSPMEIFEKAAHESSGVYVFNREKVAGVMLTQQQYESLNKEIEELHEQMENLIAEKRLLEKNGPTYTDEEVRGHISRKQPVIDKEDGWE